MDRYRPFFDAVTAAGDTVGLHVHPLRWTGCGWVSDYADDWVQSVTEDSFDAFEAAFGGPPIYHTFGDNLMTTPLMNLVRRRGARFDFTIAPGARRLLPHRDCNVDYPMVRPSYEVVPRGPYCPSADDFSRPQPGVDVASAAFLAVPISSGRFVGAPFLRRGYDGWVPAHRRVTTQVRHHLGTVRRAVTRRPHPAHRALSMADDWRSAADFWDAAFAAADELAFPCLAFAVRSDTPFVPFLRVRFDAILDQLARDPRAERLAFVTPEQAFGRTPERTT